MEKSCYKKLINIDGEVLLNTFQYEECKSCLENVTSDCEKKDFCNEDHCTRWRGFRKTKYGSVLICSNYGKKSNFIADFDVITSSLRIIKTTQDEAVKYREEEAVKRIRRVLHNIRTINAHSLQEIRSIIPDSLYKGNLKDAMKAASSHLRNNSHNIAHGILEIAKDMYSIKTEFSVYDKLIRGDAAMDKRPFNIRDVLMTVVYPFFPDFTTKDVYIDISNHWESTRIDFETMQVALYHIIENTSKYVMPSSSVEVAFPSTEKEQRIEFKMRSLYIEECEVNSIFEEGYSGKQAKENGLQGEGIGLYRARKLIERNGGTLTIRPGEEIILSAGLKYAENLFVVTIPRL